jgi:hypothetical protein
MPVGYPSSEPQGWTQQLGGEDHRGPLQSSPAAQTELRVS